MQTNTKENKIMFSNSKKIRCPYCGILRQFEEFDTREILERHAIAEYGFKLSSE
ncbi:hypothetical protein K0U27_02745 [archaeon]|nr:hypothetical protein [archaeon]